MNTEVDVEDCHGSSSQHYDSQLGLARLGMAYIKGFTEGQAVIRLYVYN